MSELTRRSLIATGIGAVALGATGAVPAVASAHPAPFVPYSRNSLFRSRVARAPVNRHATDTFRRFMHSHPEQRATPHPTINGLDGNLWGTAYATGHRGDPVWRLTGAVPADVAVLRTRGFHAPAWLGDMLSGTDDSPFVVMDRARGWSIWAANATVVGRRTIRVSAAGLFEHDSNGLDKRNPRSDSRLNFRSRGAIPDAMVIRRSLVDAGIRNHTGLGHVLHMFLVETRSAAGYCHPMTGEESGKRGWGAEGQRIAISPRVDLTRRGLSPGGLVVARTLQQHGCYIGDNSGSASAVKAEQASRRRDPWNGLLHQNSLKGITWNDFVVLPRGWQ